jgi:hypothetical protein
MEISNEHIKNIQSHKDTSVVKYPQYKEAYDYLDKIFPSSNIKSIVIYKCSRQLLNKLGYADANGFFHRTREVIVIPDNLDAPADIVLSNGINDWDNLKIEYTNDEVLVHEMLHFVSNQFQPMKSVNLEEEFAYGNSIKYFKEKGYTDDVIINKKLVIYLMSIINLKTITRRVLIENGYEIKDFMCKESAIQSDILNSLKSKILEYAIVEVDKVGKNLINIYTGDIRSETALDDNKYDLLDL